MLVSTETISPICFDHVTNQLFAYPAADIQAYGHTLEFAISNNDSTSNFP